MTKLAQRLLAPGAKRAAVKVSKRTAPTQRDAIKRASQSKPTKAKREAADAGPATATKKTRHGKVIRDSFTMPLADYQLIHMLKQRCIELGASIKKSELLRAGLRMLQGLPSEHLKAAVRAVESVKTGRPPTKNVNHGKRKKQ